MVQEKEILQFFNGRIRVFRKYRNHSDWPTEKLMEKANKILDEVLKERRTKILVYTKECNVHDHHAYMIALTIRIHALRGYPWSRENCAKDIAEYINNNIIGKPNLNYLEFYE